MYCICTESQSTSSVQNMKKKVKIHLSAYIHFVYREPGSNFSVHFGYKETEENFSVQKDSQTSVYALCTERQS